MQKKDLQCMVPPSQSVLTFFIALFMAAVFMLPPTGVYAQAAPDPFACYGIADEFNGNGNTDGLAIVNRLDGTAQVIGGTGTAGIEALAFVPQDVNGTVQQVLFAVADPTNPNTVSSNTLGTVDIATGAWTALDPAVQIGSGTDANGTTFDFSTSGDIDGLTYDVQRDILWATQRNGGDGNPDYLLQLDPATGQIVPDAFGPGIDWVEVPLATDPTFVTDAGLPYDDIDDLAVDPVTGRVFIINNKGGVGGGLVELNPATGQPLNYIGLFTGTTSADGIVDDMEGLAFFNDGVLYGSTGNNGFDPDDLNKLFVIDVATGAATLVGDFPTETRDIEALGCLTAPAFITLEKATNGQDADTPTGPTVTVGGPVTWTYVIENTGAVDLLDMTLDDDIEGDVSGRCEEGALPNPFAAGATFTCTVVGTATTEGQYANVGTVDAIYVAPGPGGDVEVPLSATDPSHYIGEAAPAVPGISIVKTAGDAADGEVYTIEAPGLVLFTYVVENTGDTHLTDITIADDAGTPADASDDVLLTSAECADLAGPLAPGGTATCTTEIQVNGDATNVAETTGTPTDETGTPLPDVDPPTDDDPADVVYAPPTPGISIIKTAGDAADGEVYTIEAPGPVLFTYVVENTGGTYLTDITIADDAGTAADTSDDVLLTDAECAGLAGPLAPGGTVTCTVELQVSGDATNIAETTGTPTDETGTPLPGVDPPTDDDPADVVYAPPAPGISIIKTAGDAADGEVYTIEAPGPVLFTYVVENTGGTHLTDITIADDAGTPADASDDILLTSAECADLAGPLAPGGTVTCTAELEVSGDATNIAETTGTPTDPAGTPLPGVDPPTDDDPADVVYAPPTPGISIIKTAGDAADGEVYTIEAPGPVLFTYVVENTGGTYLTDITIADDAGTAADTSDDVLLTDAECAGLAGPLAPGGTVTCTVELQVSGDATNIAETTGTPTDPAGTPLPGVEPPTDNDPADVVYAPPTPGISIIKTAGDAADGEVYTIEAPGLVLFTYVVENTGGTYLTNITITDDAGTPADPSDDLTIPSADATCDGDLAGPLAPGGTITCTAELQVNGDATNIAETTGTPTDPDGTPLPGVEPPTDDDPADVVYAPPTPGISIIKTAGNAADGGVYEAGTTGLVTFTYVIENTGGTYLTDITVVDDAGTPGDAGDDETVDSTTCPDLAGPLAPGGTVTCTAQIQVNGDAVNVADTTGTPTDPDGNPLPGVDPPTANDDAEVILLGSIGDTVWLDTNNDGVINPGEAGIPGVDVILTLPDGSTVTATTDGDGLYLFPDLPAGDYTVSIDTSTLPPGVAQTYDADGLATADESSLTLAPGEDNLDQDFGYIPAAPGIDIVKTAGDAADGDVLVIDAPAVVTYMYVVTNTGNTYLTDITITDDLGTADADDDVLLTNAECAGLAGPLAPGGTVTCTADIQVSGDVVNVAVTTGTPADEDGDPLPNIDPPTADDDAEVDYDPPGPGITIIKTAGDAADRDVYVITAPGEVVYTFVVENTGDTYLTDITITDDAGTPADPSDDVTLTDAECAGLAGPLAPDATVTCTLALPVSDDVTNNAATIGTPTDPAGNPLPGVDKPTDEDPADVVVLIPGISIVKTAGDAADGAVYTIDAPSLVTFSYVVENTGETYLSDITITDDAGTSTDPDDDVVLTSAECPELAGPLAQGGVISTCTAELQVNGDAINVALTTGNPTDENGEDIPNAVDPVDDDPAEVVYVPPVPGMSIVKTAGDAADGDVYEADGAGLVTFTFVVENTGGTYLTDITITDNAGTPDDTSDDVLLTSAECPDLAGPLAPGGSVTCTADIPVNGDVVNVAGTTATPTDPDGNPLPGVDPPTAEDDAEVILLGSIGDTVWLDTNSDGVIDPGESGIPNVDVILTLPDGSTVTVTTDEDGMYLFSDLPAGSYTVSVDTDTLPPALAQTYDADSLVTPNASSLELGSGEDNLDQDFGYVPAGPGISIVKTAGDAGDGDVFTIDAPGAVTYNYIVTNIGNTYLTDITIADDLGTDDTSDDVLIDSTGCAGLEGPLAPQGFVICEYDIQVNGDVVNVAVTTATPTDEDGDPIPGIDSPTAEDDAEVDYDPPGPGISIIKTAGDAADGDDYVINAPEDVLFTFVVENSGDTYLTDVTITDDAATPSDTSDDVTLTDADCAGLAGPLAPGDTVTCTLSLPMNSDGTNNAGTTGTPTDPNGNPLPGVEPPTDEDPAVVDLQAGPGISLEKTVYIGHDNGSSCPGVEEVEAASGTPVTYCFEVTNTGTTYLSDIVVNDPDLGISLPGPALLAPGDTVTLFQEATLDASLLNTADTTGIPSDENGVPIPGVDPPTSSDTAEVTPLATIGDTVWYDVNANGIQDEDEDGIEGVTVTLYGADGDVVETQVTNENGNYGFVVNPGAYSVGFSVDNMPGFYISPLDASLDEDIDSDANPQAVDPVTGQPYEDSRTIETSLVVGENDVSWDAGVYAPPIVQISKDDGGAVVQPNNKIIYSIVYSNTGITDATGVVITEEVPEFTTFSDELSTPGWDCVETPNSSRPVCTFEVGRISKGSTGRLTLTFVVFVDRFIPEDVKSINNIVTIRDDGTKGTPPDGQFTDELITPVLRPTELELAPEPGISDTGNIKFYLPTIILQ